MTRVTDSAGRTEVSLPSSLDAEILEVWDEVADLTLAEALERFTAGLTIVPHPWAKRYPALPEGTRLDPATALRLALLALGELPTRDLRGYAGRIERQPAHRAYALLSDAFFLTEHLEALPRDLRWLVVDAVIDGAYLDSRVNGMQMATGWVATAQRIDTRAGEDIDAVLPRMWRLAEEGFGADGYNDGSYDYTFDDLAEAAHDPLEAAELRLAHGLMDYAATPWDPRSQDLLRTALEGAQSRGIDIQGVCAACTPIIGTYFAGTLPRSIEHLARLLAEPQIDAT